MNCSNSVEALCFVAVNRWHSLLNSFLLAQWGIAPIFVELCEADVAANEVKRLRVLDKSAVFRFLFVLGDKPDSQGRKLLVGFQPAKALLGFVNGRG